MAATRYIAKGTTDLGTVGITAGDTLYFSEGGQTINAGTDLSALAAMAAVYVEPRCAVSIATGVVLKADITLFQFSLGGGSWYYQPGGPTTTCTTLIHNGTGRIYVVGGGTVTNYEQDGSYGWIAAEVVATHVRQASGQLDQLYNATANTDWFVTGGVFNTGRGFSGTSYVGGGAQVNVSREDTSATLPTGGTLNLGDAYVNWRGGNITAVNLIGNSGVLDLSNAPNAITATINGTAKALARCRLDSKFVTHTLTINQYCGKRTALYSAGGSGVSPL